MALWSFLRPQAKIVERKSLVAYPVPVQQGSFLEYALTGSGALTARQAMRFYRVSSAVAIAVDQIADEMEMIAPVLRMEDGKLISEHPLLELLRRPNGAEEYSEFIGQIARHWLLTHDAPIFAGGPVSRPPAELWPVKPTDLMVSSSNYSDQYPRKYHVSNGVARGSFERDETLRFGWRYYSGDMRELFHIRGFSSRETNDLADSPLEAAALEARQQILGRYHNLRMLENGARPTLVAIFKDIVDNAELEQRRQSLAEQAGGAHNSGNIMTIAAEDVELKEFSINNRDMDFANLDKAAQEAIFLRYKIPLPLVSMDASTFNNMEQAVYHLYDRAVLPNFQKVMNGLGRMLFPRYGLDPSSVKLTYNPESISALQERRLDELKKRRDVNIETVNELRQLLPNREPLEGGDVFYQNATLVPAGSDLFTDDGDEALRRLREDGA
jgi:HK97 family phage portal protein